MVNTTTSINKALSYSSDFESDHENENEKTPFVSSKHHSHGVLSGNTLLVNGGHSSSVQTKAPKKQKRIMKASKRFKIFGNMRIPGGRNYIEKDKKKDTMTTSAYDFSKLGQSRYLKEFQQSDDKETEHRETIYYERVMNRHLSSSDTLLNSTSDSQTMDVSRSHSSENCDMKSRSQSTERDQIIAHVNPTINAYINIQKGNQKGVRQNKIIPQQMINPNTMRGAERNSQGTNNEMSETYQNLFVKHSVASRHNNIHNVKRLHSNRIPSQLPMTNTMNSLDIHMNIYNRNPVLEHYNIVQGQYNDDDVMSKVSELSMTSPTAVTNKNFFLHKILNSCYQGENQDNSAYLCNVTAMNDKIEESNSDDSSSENSNDLCSSIVEIAVEPQQVLSKISTISSNSEDVVDVESEDDDCTQDETKSEMTHPKYKILIQTKKLLSLLQDKFSDCFVPEGFSSPSDNEVYHNN
jgi:hypothetical protein